MNNPIRKYRTDNELTLDGFAIKVGVRKSTVWKWENGIGPSLNVARHIEKTVGIPKEDLRPDIWPPLTTEAA